ncbi:MAG: hypothetical protein KC416_15140, partial [Myxococcales bacterium]|nr:hypothetical protein [Myxococcales bacterium]
MDLDLKFPWLYPILAFVGMALGGLYPLYNPDGYGHIAQGRDIVERGYVPDVDPFSVWKPEPAPWFNYEWGFDVLAYGIYSSLGPNGLLALKCIVLGLAGVVLLLAVRQFGDRAGTRWCTLVLLLLAIPGARFRFSERPEVLALLFSSVLLWGLAYLARPNARRRWFVVAGLSVQHVLWV